MTVYFDDLLKEMERLEATAPDGFTTYETGKALGRSQAWCRKKIRMMVEAGKIIYAGEKKIERSDKRTGYSPVYRMVGE